MATSVGGGVPGLLVGPRPKDGQLWPNWPHERQDGKDQRLSFCATGPGYRSRFVRNPSGRSDEWHVKKRKWHPGIGMG